MRLTLRNGGASYVWFEDITDYVSIATANFHPLGVYQATPTAATLSHMYTHLKNGFGVKNATDNSGYIYAVTWSQYDAYVKANRGIAETAWDIGNIVPRQIHLLAGEWCVTPIAKVYADNDATYPSTVATINIGRIL